MGALLTRWKLFSSEESDPFPSTKGIDKDGNTALISHICDAGGADIDRSALLFPHIAVIPALYTSSKSVSRGIVAATTFVLPFPPFIRLF